VYGKLANPDLPVLQSIQTIIFDMDGVIVDSEPLHARAGELALATYGIDAPMQGLQQQFKGMTDHALFAAIVQQSSQLDPSWVDRLIAAKAEAFYRLLDQIPLVPEVMDFLPWARQRYTKLGLATSATPQDQGWIFTQFQLHAWFDVVVTAADIQKAKPDPDPYLTAASRLGIDPPYCLVIEDSLNGIRSAKAAGCRAVGLTTSFGSDALYQAGADLVVQGFRELMHLL
jgi:HAD superfamily hydrolase (TIGR01509 family)